MKEKNEQQFTPDRIDEQIAEQFIDKSQTTPEARFLAGMQQVASQVRAEHEQALQRVEDRLLKYSAEHSTALPVDRPEQLSSVREARQGDLHFMEQKKDSSETRQSSSRRRLSLLVAIIVMTALVGGLVLIQNRLRPTTQIGARTTATVTPTPASMPEGTVVYSTLLKSNSLFSGFSRLDWSPDSQRIASLDNQGNLKIWDATTGKHAVTISMPGTQELPLDISWSPDSKLLAIATGAHLLIVNSQSGAIVRTYTAPVTSASISSNSPYLSDTLPKSGDTIGFNAVAWSPDGRWLATSSTINPPVFTIQVLDAQTGVTAFTLPGGDAGVGSFAWSSDSLYLAGLTTTNSNSVDRVWNISTRQIVASYTETGTGGPIWQPGTHNLALVKYALQAGALFASAIVIWNPLTGKELRQFPVAEENLPSDSLAWSPDGQRLVYGILPLQKKQTDMAVIIDANTGQQLYVYPAGNRHFTTLVAWSPNGKYIISGAGSVYSTFDTQQGAQVWIA